MKTISSKVHTYIIPGILLLCAATFLYTENGAVFSVVCVALLLLGFLEFYLLSRVAQRTGSTAKWTTSVLILATSAALAGFLLHWQEREKTFEYQAAVASGLCPCVGLMCEGPPLDCTPAEARAFFLDAHPLFELNYGKLFALSAVVLLMTFFCIVAVWPARPTPELENPRG